RPTSPTSSKTCRRPNVRRSSRRSTRKWRQRRSKSSTPISRSRSSSRSTRTASPTSSRKCFFFQAEDGIRDRNVTGVQTCALPICVLHRLRQDPACCARAGLSEGHRSGGAALSGGRRGATVLWHYTQRCGVAERQDLRSEERRVGKE